MSCEPEKNSALTQVAGDLLPKSFLKNLAAYRSERDEVLEREKQNGNELTKDQIKEIQRKLLAKYGLIGALK